jgi:hypothetical protein
LIDGDRQHIAVCRRQRRFPSLELNMGSVWWIQMA